ncbi:MAG: hypothetical protein R2726_03365 [Acidimicrobiales bacterium]
MAGAWRFASRGGPHTRPDADGTHITVAFLDDDPLAVAGRISPLLGSHGDLAYAGPFETITPWRWDWFDDSPAAT